MHVIFTEIIAYYVQIQRKQITSLFVTHDQHMKLIHKSLGNKNEHISPDSLVKCL